MATVRQAEAPVADLARFLLRKENEVPTSQSFADVQFNRQLRMLNFIVD
jgi:hypothetical protein